MPDTAEAVLELSLSRSALDRAAPLRKDPESLGRALDDSATRVLDVYGDRVPVEPDAERPRLRFRSPRSGDAEAALLLGTAGGVTYLAHPHEAEDDGDDPRSTLRRLGTVLSDLDVGVLAAAQALINWHAASGFCPRCGAPTRSEQGGWVRVCTREGRQHFPRTDPAVIMSVVDREDRLLLAQGAGWPANRMSVLAGFVEPGESLEAAVAREVAEEVGVAVRDVRYRGNQPWPFPASLMLGFRARADDAALTLDPEEIADARWFTRDELERAVADGALGIPPALSIARHLIEDWFGGTLHEPEPLTEFRPRD